MELTGGAATSATQGVGRAVSEPSRGRGESAFTWLRPRPAEREWKMGQLGSWADARKGIARRGEMAMGAGAGLRVRLKRRGNFPIFQIFSILFPNSNPMQTKSNSNMI